MTRFVALTGLPRSGSTLCCHLVAATPDAVALVFDDFALSHRERMRVPARCVSWMNSNWLRDCLTFSGARCPTLNCSN